MEKLSSVDVVRSALWIGWVFGIFLASLKGNHVFTDLAFRWGPAASLLVAFCTGWMYLWVSQALVLPRRRREAVVATAMILAPLCALLGLWGLQQVRSIAATTGDLGGEGVGPVNQVAYLVQALGIALASRHELQTGRSSSA